MTTSREGGIPASPMALTSLASWTCLSFRDRLVDRFKKMASMNEISGAFGDLGTFLPLMLGLAKVVNLNVGTTLLFTGLYNLFTGFFFDVPMPVQPMKAISAVALSLSGSFTLEQVMAAGLFVSATVLVLGATGLMGLAGALMPAAVIRGMQLGVGLSLSVKGWKQMWYANSSNGAIRQWWTVQGLFIGIFAAVFIVLTSYPRTDQRQDGVSTTSITRVRSDDSETPCQQVTLSNAKSSVEVDASQENKKSDEPPTESLDDIEKSQDRSRDNSGDLGGPLGPEEGQRGRGDQDILGPPPQGWMPSRLAHLKRPLDWLLSVGAAASRASDSDSSVAPLPTTRATIPAALLLTVIGFVSALASSPSARASLRLGPSTIYAVVPSPEDWRIGIVQAGLPQLALTSFNSVISTCNLAGKLFPKKAPRVAAVSVSLGLMNLVGGWFQVMPTCHGAGGLAAQVRYGARSGAAPMFLGLVKIFLALLLGSSLSELLAAFPSSLLGAMLVFAGAELAAGSRGQTGHRGMAIMLLTAAATLAMENVAIGVAAGLIAAYSLAAKDFLLAHIQVSCMYDWVCKR